MTSNVANRFDTLLNISFLLVEYNLPRPPAWPPYETYKCGAKLFPVAAKLIAIPAAGRTIDALECRQPPVRLATMSVDLRRRIGLSRLGSSVPTGDISCDLKTS
jgi:hypothetical protein